MFVSKMEQKKKSVCGVGCLRDTQGLSAQWIRLYTGPYNFQWPTKPKRTQKVQQHTFVI